jgi:alkylation response protein AidB-like acyl-CoA dehydrogenase
MATTTTSAWLENIESISEKIIAPAAAEIDAAGAFPRAAITAMGKAGLLGLVSGREAGGLGEGHAAATRVVERIARDCASTAMVVCMHYCGAAVIEAFGPREAREAVARGEHVTTPAFSESGSRSQFRAPMSAAVSVFTSPGIRRLHGCELRDLPAAWTVAPKPSPCATRIRI